MAALLVLAALASMALTWAARAYALRRQLVDEPGERRSHAVPTPRGGGIGPVGVFIALVATAGMQGWIAEASWPWLVGALGLVAGIGSWDDHRPLGAAVRLAAHVVAGAMVAVAFGLWSASPVLATAVVFGCVVMINVWNFMDGIDGIAATQTALVAVAAASFSSGTWSPLAAGLAACVVGFLPLNFPRARIFLGDVGSGALGLALAIFAVALVASRPHALDPYLLLLPAAAFLVDSALTLFRRMLRGERWWTPHTQHLYQALARRHGHPRVTTGYAAWSAVSLAGAWMLEGAGIGITLACVLLWYMACAAVWLHMQRSTRWIKAG